MYRAAMFYNVKGDFVLVCNGYGYSFATFTCHLSKASLFAELAGNHLCVYLPHNIVPLSFSLAVSIAMTCARPFMRRRR